MTDIDDECFKDGFDDAVEFILAKIETKEEYTPRFWGFACGMATLAGDFTAFLSDCHDHDDDTKAEMLEAVMACVLDGFNNRLTDPNSGGPIRARDMN